MEDKGITSFTKAPCLTIEDSVINELVTSERLCEKQIQGKIVDNTNNV
jgi:hypothetical protein